MAAQSWYTTRWSELWKVNQKGGRGCAWWELGRPLAGNQIPVCPYLNGLVLPWNHFVCATAAAFELQGAKPSASWWAPSVPCMLLVSPLSSAWLADKNCWVLRWLLRVVFFSSFPAPLFLWPVHSIVSHCHCRSALKSHWLSLDLIIEKLPCGLVAERWLVLTSDTSRCIDCTSSSYIVNPFINTQYAFIFRYSVHSPDLYNYMCLYWIRKSRRNLTLEEMNRVSYTCILSLKNWARKLFNKHGSVI